MLFVDILCKTAEQPLVYEDSDLLDYALTQMPLEQLYAEAEAASEQDTEWGTQDHLIRAMLKWFKKDFFVWVGSDPPCPQCRTKTRGIGNGELTPEDRANGARVVELFSCPACNHVHRFPRYNSPRKLMTTRKGRCGEWANCFTMLCRALGSRARYVWIKEDHVSTEVYSFAQKRWVHVDACEAAWDNPTIYQTGWGKKMSYVIAFSVEGAADVTPRYVRPGRPSNPRNLISEQELAMTLRSITESLRDTCSASEIAELKIEDEQEQREFAAYTDGRERPTATQEQLPRQSGNAEWVVSRGEDGTS
ncbi:uncharacterized protein V1518DRAFT_370363 [Limtongia smithiae]|uniref:uncharacterized protein n=1 Tax=Limtongia smithiae TaxID=1125753 RepID=UPI0034CF1C04